MAIPHITEVFAGRLPTVDRESAIVDPFFCLFTCTFTTIVSYYTAAKRSSQLLDSAVGELTISKT
ncbi:hypothetical protein, partial [Chamaesiphon sp. OTE_8_metabat_110]|uniref:hypothetical protein n=1 Tax=Chamaesiphon sp. OTE_8_metabat_110 TaxID=2964696 RepID=UPI00286D31BF